METLERLQQYRKIIEDFSAHSLVAIPSEMGRLLHVASLRDLASGRYRHQGLATIYSEAAVHEALGYCHEELFAKVLEMSLEQQEWDLRMCLESLEGSFREIALRWLELESYRILIPMGAPGYLKDLFCSNVRALLRVLAPENPRITPAA